MLTDIFHLAFTIDPQDTLKPSVFDGAPSRPPSRVSTRAGQLMGQAGGKIFLFIANSTDEN